MSVIRCSSTVMVMLSLALILYGTCNMYKVAPIKIAQHVDGKHVEEVIGIRARFSPQFGGESEEDVNIGINTENKDESNTSNDGISITSNGAEYVVITFIGIAIYTVVLMNMTLGYRKEKTIANKDADLQRSKRYEERDAILIKLEEAVTKLGDQNV